MAIAFDTTTQGNAITGGTASDTFSHAANASADGALVFVSQNGTTDNVSGVTYGGTSMTQVTGSPTGDGSVGQEHAFFLGDLTGLGGTQNVVVTTNSVGAGHGLISHCVTVTAANTTSIVDQDAQSGSASGDITGTLSLTSITCFAAVGWFSGKGAVGNISPLTSWTSQHEHDFGGTVGGLYTYDTIGSSDITAGINHSGAADTYSLISVAIREDAGGATGRSFIMLLGVS